MRAIMTRLGIGAVAALSWGVFANRVAGQNPDMPNVYLSVSVDAKQKMQLLDNYVEQKNWTEAVDLLQTLAEKQGDRLAPTAAENPSLFINLRTYCNARLAALPAEALTTYRARADGQAEALWKLWEQNRDPRALQKIAEEFFCSTTADRAIDRLGDRALAEGRLVDAVGWWAKLLPRDWDERAGEFAAQLEFRCPTPRTDPARIAAKMVLAKALAGDLPGAHRMLGLLRAKFPNARGRLGGVEGLYTELLGKLLASSDLALPKADDDFPTFAGDERRNKASNTKADVGGLQFLWDFDVDNANEREESPVNDLRLPHFPAVVGDAVYAATDSAVWKFDLKTGKAVRWFDFGSRGSELPRAKYTVTIKGRRLFVTVHDQKGGNPERRLRPFGPRREWHTVNSTLICFDLTDRKELWRANPSDFGADRGAVFEGSPIAVGDDLCIAVTRYDAMSETSVLRIDVSGRRVIWKAVVCESMADNSIAEPPMYNLLSLGDSTIYYCTNLGAVAAVRVEDGKLQWVATYTRRAPPTTAPGDPAVPDLNPCVVHQGRVFALPRDGRRLVCYDAQTGEKRWESPAGLALSHILGAQDGLVIATGSRVCAFDAATGKLQWMRPANSTPGFGRGLIAGGEVYWPTRTDIHVFDLKTGDLARPPIELFTRLGQRPGNLLRAGDYLLVAQSHRLLAFCSFSKLIERHRKEITANPEAPEPRFKLGDALMQRGEFAEAADAFAAATERAGPLRVVDGRKLYDDAQDRRFQALLALAEKQPAPTRANVFRKAFLAARTPEQQVIALKSEFQSADSKRQVEICQVVLDAKTLRAASLGEKNGAAEPAGQWAAAQLRRLIGERGRSLYSAQEADFAKVLAGAKDTAALLELAERYPLAFTLAKTLQARASTALREGDPRTAGRISMEWLTAAERAEDDKSAQEAIALLVQCKSALKRPEAAYLWAANLARREKGDWPARPEIRREEFDIRPGTSAYSVAMTSAGVHQDLPRYDVQVTIKGESSILQWRSGDKTSTGHITSLSGAVAWVGRVGDELVVAVGEDLALFGPNDPKTPRWRKRVREPGRFRSVATSAGVRPPAIAPAADRFLVAGDLIVAAGEQSVMAIDVADGSERWRMPIEGSAERPPGLLLADATLLINADGETVALDPTTGRRLFSTATRVLSAAAAGDLLAFAERTAVIGRDQRSGAEHWRVALPNPATRDPLVLADREQLFVVVDGAQLVALKQDGSAKWRLPLAGGPAVDAAAAAANGSVAVAAGGALECWDARSGERRWRKRLESVELADDLGFALSAFGDRLTAVQRGGGKEFVFALATGESIRP